VWPNPLVRLIPDRIVPARSSSPGWRWKSPHLALKLFLLIFTTVNPGTLAGACWGSASPSKAELIRGIRVNYDKFVNITTLKLVYRIEYQHLAGASRYGFKKADSLNLRKGKMRKVEMRTSLGVPPREIQRICTWNGKFGMMTESWKTIEITKEPDNWIYYYSHYEDQLCYPSTLALVPSLKSRLKAELAGFFLPAAVEMNATEYGVRTESEDVDGKACWVMDRPGHDSLWIDAENGFVIRRREVYHPKTTHRRQRYAFKDFQVIGSVLLPYRIERDDFGGLDEDASFWDKICNRKIVELLEVSTAPISDSEFQLSIPDMATVRDAVRHKTYTNVGAKGLPAKETLALATAEHTTRHLRNSIYSFLAAGLAVLIAVVALWRWRRDSLMAS
jgi:hypothetical protein